MAAEPSAGGLRIALLAHNAATRTALANGLREAGLDAVFTGDPLQIQAAELAQARPQAVLVALDVTVEAALSRFEDVLFDPAVQVIYEEADAVLARDAWESARWSRHLLAKLRGHDNVLPPTPRIEQPTGPAKKFNTETVIAQGLVPGQTLLPSYLGLVDPVSADRVALKPSIAQSNWGGNLSLVPMEATLTPAFDSAPAHADVLAPMQVIKDVGEVESVLAASEPATSTIAQEFVLVRAGIGGPDALRQMLAGISPESNTALLIRQHLYGGRYEHLIRQLERVCALPVSLAKAGDSVLSAHVYLLPDFIGLAQSGSKYKFVEDMVDDFSVLPAAGNGVVLLSGCGEAVMQAAMTWAQSGAQLAAQSPETCFDAEASVLLQNKGGKLAAPVDLLSAVAQKEYR